MKALLGTLERRRHSLQEKQLPSCAEQLREGDILLMVDGGHGFRMLEDTVFLEIKQGPYTGIEDKERF